MDLFEKYKLHQFEGLLSECENKISDLSVIEQRDFSTFLLYTIGKSFTTAREIIGLCGLGFPDGALSLSRNVFEQFITVLYMASYNNHPDFSNLLEAYFDNATVQLDKAFKEEAKLIKDSSSEARYEAEISEIYSNYNSINRSDYWWIKESNKSFKGMFDYVYSNIDSLRNLLNQMLTIYKMSCLSIHASMRGNEMRMGSQFDGVDVGPWSEGQEISLYQTSLALIGIIGKTFSSLNIEKKAILASLNELAEFYRGIIKTRNKEFSKNGNDG